MRLIPLTLGLFVIGLSGPALAEDTCNGTNDPCKVGDCVGGDMLGRDHLWSPNSACKVSAASGGAGSLASGASGGGTAGSGPAGISDQAAAGNLTSFLTTAQADKACRSPTAGVLTPVARGCRIPVGQEPWCSTGGGQIARSGGKQFCIPKGSGER
jgi:hypothetical protein